MHVFSLEESLILSKHYLSYYHHYRHHHNTPQNT